MKHPRQTDKSFLLLFFKKEALPCSSQRGFALLIVLWTLVLITLVVSQLAATARSETRLTLNLRQAQAAQDAADGAVYQAMLRLMDIPAKAWVADGRPYQLRLTGAAATVQVRDEAGKINPNTASLELLQALVHSAGADMQTAATVARNVVDWRFPNGSPQPLAAQYQAAGRRYAPPRAPLQTVGELGLVLGVSAPLLARLRPHLTVWHAGDPDPSLADPVVLAAIKAQTGAALATPTPDPQLRILTITAAAVSLAGTRFTRRAVVALGGADRAGLWRILEWQAAAPAS